MADLVPYHKGRLSRKRLREWLSLVGPQSLDAIHFQAKIQTPAVSPEEVERQLTEHPDFFERGEDGRWYAVEEASTIVVRPKPRPRHRPKQAVGPITRDREPDERPRRAAPEPNVPLVLDGGRLRSVVFSPDGAGAERPFESGGHLLVPVPQVGPADADTLTRLADACAVSDAVEVYERTTGGRALFRGTRRLLHAVLAPEGGRLHLIFGPAEDDDGRFLPAVRERAAKPIYLLPSGTETSTSALTLVRGVGEAVQLPPAVVALAARPAASRRYDRAAAKQEVERRLNAVRLDYRRWSEFAEWLAGKKTEYDQALMVTILPTVLAVFVHDPVRVFQLAKAVLEPGTTPTSAFARSYCIALSNRLYDDEAIAWAEQLLPQLPATPESDPEIALAAARLALHRCRYAEAARFFGVGIESVGRSDLVQYLMAATWAGDVAMQRRALELVDAHLAESESFHQIEELEEAAGYALQVAVSLETRVDHWLEVLLQINLARKDAQGALRAYQTWTEEGELSFENQLRLLSLLEEVDDAYVITSLVAHLSALINREWDAKSNRILDQAIDQLRALESLIERFEGPPSALLTSKLSARYGRGVPSQKPERSTPLRDRTVTLIGGRQGTRRRVEARLKELGARDVRHVPPSWEDHLDKSTIRSKLAGADYAVEITDFIKHDALDAIRSLQGSGLGFHHVQTTGGPSRIVRALLDRVAAEAS